MFFVFNPALRPTPCAGYPGLDDDADAMDNVRFYEYGASAVPSGRGEGRRREDKERKKIAREERERERERRMR